MPILLVLSTSSLLLLDQRTLQIKYRVPAAEIYRMSLSPYLDDIAVFHVKAVSINIYTCVMKRKFKNSKIVYKTSDSLNLGAKRATLYFKRLML